MATVTREEIQKRIDLAAPHGASAREMAIQKAILDVLLDIRDALESAG